MTTTPDPQEINALVLTSCFGWRWESKVSQPSDKRLTALIAPEGDALGYSPSNYDPAVWSPSDATAERFDDWNTANLRYDQKGFPITSALPNFYEDANLLPLLLDKVAGGHEYDFLDNLSEMVRAQDSSENAAIWACMTATPRQQAEAVLRTLGHWPAEWRSEREGSDEQFQAPDDPAGDHTGTHPAGVPTLRRWRPGVERTLRDMATRGR